MSPKCLATTIRDCGQVTRHSDKGLRRAGSGDRERQPRLGLLMGPIPGGSSVTRTEVDSCANSYRPYEWPVSRPRIPARSLLSEILLRRR